MDTNAMRRKMNALHITTLLRVVLGGVFVFSAVVKGVDPYGTVLKIGEYLGAFMLPILEPMAGVGAVALVAVEMWLGVALITAAWPRLTLVLTFVVSGLFTLLTLVLAVWNPVSDCGCFGDVVVLTNWQTFVKNVALVALTLLVGWGYDIWGAPKRVGGWRTGRWITPFTTLATILLTAHALVELPLVEKFPFGVGVDLNEVVMGGDEEIEQVRVVCRHKVDGHEEEFLADDSRWWNTDEWEFVRTVESAANDKAEVRGKDFMLYDEAGDATAQIIATKGVVSLLCVQNLWKLTPDQQTDLLLWTERALERGERVVIAVATPLKRATTKLAKLGIPTDSVEVCNMDITTMQVVVRAPAGVVRIDNGVIADKYSIYRLGKH